MIDTIVLTLTKDMYQITDPDKFKPSAKLVLNENIQNYSGIQSKQNPTKKELLEGIYKPRLTLTKRFTYQGGSQISLKIELSLPKLFFGNNFNELQYKDFRELLKKLVLRLKDMGVIVSSEILSRAPISAIHYSKNIILTDGSTPYHYINKIKEANIKLSLDTNQTDYRNEGHSYRWHCNSYEVVFYDKIKDLEKARQSEKRALEKDNTLQLYLFKKFEKRKNKFEVLRMEVRLNKRQKIKQLFNILDIKSDLTFKKLFKPAISKKVLLHYIDELESKRLMLLDYKAVNDKALLTALILNNPNLKPRQIFQMLGLRKALEVFNTRELKSIFSKYNQKNWDRLIADANKIKLPFGQSPFEFIKKHLIRFELLKLS